MSLLLTIAILCNLLIILRAISNSKKLISNLRWLHLNSTIHTQSKPTTHFIICIPMLREQKIVANTLDYFSQLNYPKDHYQIFVVTTERENKQKKQNKSQLNQFISDLNRDVNRDSLLEKYLGLFPENDILQMHQSLSGLSISKVTKTVNHRYKNLKSTNDLAHQASTTINQNLNHPLIKVLHYPNPQGVMSHQINYCLKHTGHMETSSSTFFAVYNADSRPHPDTLRVLDQQIKRYKKKHHYEINILQQSSLFTLNYNNFQKTLRGNILKAAAIFQTKWTLIHELTRLRNQSNKILTSHLSWQSTLRHTTLAHCVGHGLFIRLSFMKQHPLPTETVNEDLPYGYYQSCRGEPIVPVPILENSESPVTLKSHINQKKVWFWPYLEYLKCRKNVITKKSYRSILEVNILTTQAIVTGVIWFMQSLIFLVPFIYGLIEPTLWYWTLYLLAYALYWIIPVTIIYLQLDFLESRAARHRTIWNIRDLLVSTFTGWIVIITHSFGPILCTKEYLNVTYFGHAISKNKTER